MMIQILSRSLKLLDAHYTSVIAMFISQPVALHRCRATPPRSQPLFFSISGGLRRGSGETGRPGGGNGRDDDEAEAVMTPPERTEEEAAKQI